MTTATKVASVIVPEIFVPYVDVLTREKVAMIRAGAMVESPIMNQLLAGGGITFNVPGWKDLDGTGSDLSLQADDAAGNATPRGIGSVKEIAARISRSQGWSSSDLSAALAGEDPMAQIADRVAGYWARQTQYAFVAAVKGIFADNAAAPTGADTHLINDMTVDIKGASFVNGTTNFSAEAFIDAQQTMGDAKDALAMLMVHSVVEARMRKNNLIDFIPDSRGETQIATFQGLQLVADDGLPVAAGVYESWIFGRGAVLYGSNTPKVPVEFFRAPAANNGSGEEQLWSRVEWAIHPTGHAYIQAGIDNGGPDNTDLAAAANWSRRYPERKQISIARLITRES